MRFEIRSSGLLRPLFLAFGATGRRDFVEIEDGRLRARFGAIFDHTFDLGEIAEVGRARWPWYGGLGWRTDFTHAVGLIGSLTGVVKIVFSHEQRARLLLLPVRYTELYVSLEDPDGFVREAAERLA